MNKQDFFNLIVEPIKKYAVEYGIKVISPIIAQACVESAWGESLLSKDYNNYFGLKCGSDWNGKSVNLQTGEEYGGVEYKIYDDFRVFDTLDEGIKGYFDFISSYNRYHKLFEATTSDEYISCLAESGYATSSTYASTLNKIISYNNLSAYDYNNTQEIEYDFDDIVNKTKRGDFGNYPERRDRLEAIEVGLYNRVQAVINGNVEDTTFNDTEEIYNGYTIDELALAVYRGEFGNNPERKEKLNEISEGLYDKVQNRVMELFYN